MADLPHRKSPRLATYDYGQNGLYFVIICVQNRLCLFGKVREAVMERNAAGDSVGASWAALSPKFPNVEPADFVVMPNHFHGILIIEKPETPSENGEDLPRVMQWFKTMTTNAYIRGVEESGWTAFEGKLWQRSYHDHIIRDEAGLLNIQTYIQENPARWSQDTYFHDDS